LLLLPLLLLLTLEKEQLPVAHWLRNIIRCIYFHAAASQTPLRAEHATVSLFKTGVQLSWPSYRLLVTWKRVVHSVIIEQH
jgi:hypothetical protein